MSTDFAKRRSLMVLLVAAAFSTSTTAGEPPDPAAVERGRKAMEGRQFLNAEWSDAAFKGVAKFWGEPAPDPDVDPDGYARAFAKRYGFHPAPFPNDGLPMGLKRSTKADGKTRGMQVDCLVCHGGSIGGKSYVGLPNTQIDYAGFFPDLFRADGRRLPILPFVLNTSRGTTNAGMMSVALMAFRNSDLSLRRFPMAMGTNLPELDAPPWWVLKYKTTMYYDGRTPAGSVRSIMQFLLAEKTADQFRELEPAFADIHAYLLSIEPPKYPFAVDADAAARGRAVFEESCAKCHGAYGERVDYPNVVVPLDVIKTDPARIEGLSELSVNHYNSTWFAERHPVDVDAERGYQAPPLVGIWASAPYLHNGSVPTLRALLDSRLRPRRYLRPPSTDFEHYDQRDVGWKFVEAPDGPPDPKDPRRVFDASRYGLGVGGHTFGDKLSEAQRSDLIEYLKTL
ncbi:c-type cytochrome [Paludisphaera rhizosphaerae]|uniref:c-type cytochrome n=1 Tax=Paludisphaera rhizosphaerae TaxID=2711216 RepID=UPI001F0EAC2F|nr:c-type cytochrome [Paludisphaera rhizosphaerae]